MVFSLFSRIPKILNNQNEIITFLFSTALLFVMILCKYLLNLIHIHDYYSHVAWSVII